MNRKKETSENRRALPKFALTMLASLLAGGVLGFVVGVTRGFGVDTAAFARGLSEVIRAVTPWGIPATSVLTMGAAFVLYRVAAGRFSAWDGGDVDETSETIEGLLDWVLLLSSVQLLIDLFFMAAVGVYIEERGALWIVAAFLVSCGCVIFAQQKAVDLERRMNPEKHGSVYDSKFQKKWWDSCDESERQQIGQACYHSYQVTSRVCLGAWLVLTVLGMVFEMNLLPVSVLLAVWGVMQVSYALECMRLSRKKT